MNRLYSKGNYLAFYNDDPEGRGFTYFPKLTAFFQKSDDETFYTIQTLTGKRAKIYVSEIVNTGNDEAPSITKFADEAEFLTLLTENTSICCDSGGGGAVWGAITGTLSDQADLSIELDAKLESGDNVSELANDAGYISDNYEERWDQFNAGVTGVWQTVTLPSAPADRIVGIVIQPVTTNDFIGVRSIGSTAGRILRHDTDSSLYLTVRTNGAGQVQIYTSQINANFFVESYKN
jgi:hypothetical protein